VINIEKMISDDRLRYNGNLKMINKLTYALITLRVESIFDLIQTDIVRFILVYFVDETLLRFFTFVG